MLGCLDAPGWTFFIRMTICMQWVGVHQLKKEPLRDKYIQNNHTKCSLIKYTTCLVNPQESSLHRVELLVWICTQSSQVLMIIFSAILWFRKVKTSAFTCYEAIFMESQRFIDLQLIQPHTQYCTVFERNIMYHWEVIIWPRVSAVWRINTNLFWLLKHPCSTLQAEPLPLGEGEWAGKKPARFSKGKRLCSQGTPAVTIK